MLKSHNLTNDNIKTHLIYNYSLEVLMNKYFVYIQFVSFLLILETFLFKFGKLSVNLQRFKEKSKTNRSKEDKIISL